MNEQTETRGTVSECVRREQWDPAPVKPVSTELNQSFFFILMSCVDIPWWVPLLCSKVLRLLSPKIPFRNHSYRLLAPGSWLGEWGCTSLALNQNTSQTLVLLSQSAPCGQREGLYPMKLVLIPIQHPTETNWHSGNCLSFTGHSGDPTDL